MTIRSIYELHLRSRGAVIFLTDGPADMATLISEFICARGAPFFEAKIQLADRDNPESHPCRLELLGIERHSRGHIVLRCSDRSLDAPIAPSVLSVHYHTETRRGVVVLD